MGRNAYLIVTDLHFSYKNLRNRYDYRAEVLDACKFIINLAADYKRKGYTITLLLLGDVFHRSYSDVFNACTDNNFFYMWANTFGEIYSVIGNHELSYYSSNPFYTLVSDIESDKVQSILNRVWQPVGSAGVIKVVDSLEDGEVLFHFNHFGTTIAKPVVGKHNIGLFHQDIVNSEILNNSAEKLGLPVHGVLTDIEGSGIFNGYDYAFLGHLHTVYGTFQTNAGTILCYLASIGRTNINEVNDNFLERNIPVVCVEDGKLTGMFDNKFSLMKRADCVHEMEVLENREKADLRQNIKQIKSQPGYSDNPVDNVLSHLAGNTDAVRIFKELLESEADPYETELHTRIHDAIIKALA